MAVALLAPAAAHAEIEGDFAAQADASQLFVDAVNFGSLTPEPPVGSLTTIGVSPTQAQVDNPDGLGGGIISRGFGQNLDATLFDQEIPLDLSTAEQTAPPDNTEPEVATLIPLDDASPLLSGSVSQSTALARDPAALECPDQDARTTVSEGTSTTSDLGVLVIDEEAGVALASIRDNAGEGTLTSTSGTYIGSAGEVIAESKAQSASVNVASELEIEVLNPVLTATASGTPGGASVDYTGEVRVNGDKIAGTQENQLSLEALREVLLPLDEEALNTLFGPLDENVVNPLLEPIADALPLLDGEALTGETLVGLIDDGAVMLDELAFLEPTVLVTAGQLENVTESADGTRASGEVKAVRVELNVVSTLTETTVPIFTFHLMPMAVDAEAPVGGVDCGGVADDPLDEVHKDVTAAKVRPGTTFDYAITVPNTDDECTLTNVTVTDVVEGPGTIVSTTPTGQVDGNTVTWTIDELAPNASETFIVTVRVDDDAQNGATFDDRVTVTADCDGEEVDGGDTIDDIPVVTTDSLDGCDVSPSNKSATHLEVMPGQTFSYLIHAYNAGDEDCGQTIVTDTLPEGATFVSCTPECQDSGQEIVFVIDELAAGQAVELTITVTAPDAPTNDMTNVATIDPANGSSTDVSTDIPDVTDRSVPAPPDPADFEAPASAAQPDAAPADNLPRTGGGLALLGLGAMAAASRLRRRG